jgi:hypothetical protein
MLGYWPYATHKKTCFLDICIFVTVHRKPGILNTRLIYIFLQNKKNSDLKINIPENHKSLSLSFIFFLKKKKRKRKQHVRLGHLPKQVTRFGHKKRSAVFSMNKAKCMQIDHVTVQVN